MLLLRPGSRELMTGAGEVSDVGEKNPVSEGRGRPLCFSACGSNNNYLSVKFSLFVDDHLILMELELIEDSIQVYSKFLHDN